MKIKDLYTKAETEKKAKNLLGVSILIPGLLILFVIVISCFLSYSTIEDQSKEQIEVIATAVKNCAFLDTPGIKRTKLTDIYSDCAVLYFDKEGNLVSYDIPKNVNKDDFPSNYSDCVKLGNKTTIGKERYRIAYNENIEDEWMAGNSGGCFLYVVFLDVTEEYKAFLAVMWTSIGIFIVAFAILFTFSYFWVGKQSANYEEAINRNSRLISDISHEFNTPLAIIKSGVSNIMSEPEKQVEDVSDKLVAITHETGRLSRMVKDMLTLSKADSDRLILQKKECDISSIVLDTIEPFQMMCELDEKKMIAHIQKGVKSYTDEDKIKQAIIVLLDNAVKYTEKKDKIEVTLRSTKLKYEIIVADTGNGVAESELQNIFERFYRTDYSRNSETGGSGLGLSIVKAIMIALKGRVYAETNTPKGLKVVLEFPKEREV